MNSSVETAPSEGTVDFDELIVIPARFRSTRLPGKPLVDIAGKPMIVRTAERCLRAVDREQVIVATDDERIANVVDSYGFKFEMTRDDHPTGSDRVAEIAKKHSALTYINVQGDEPAFNPDDITRVIKEMRKDRSRTLIGYCPMTQEQFADTKFIKLIFGLDNRLIYIGRAQVPHGHTGEFKLAYRQVCIYGYSRAALERFASTGGRTPLELIEDNEVMRFLELGERVDVVQLSSDSHSVDRPSDIGIVAKLLREQEALT